MFLSGCTDEFFGKWWRGKYIHIYIYICVFSVDLNPHPPDLVGYDDHYTIRTTPYGVMRGSFSMWESWINMWFTGGQREINVKSQLSDQGDVTVQNPSGQWQFFLRGCPELCFP